MTGIAPFGATADGREIRRITLAAGPLRAELLDFGARLQGFWRGGGANACVAGRTPAEIEGTHVYCGPIIAPVINRLSPGTGVGGRRIVGDAVLLHSGALGGQVRIWQVAGAEPDRVTFRLALADMADGFPGNRTFTADYRLSDALELDLTARTDRPTLLNPGLHGVFAPDGVTDPAELSLTIPADTYLPTDARIIPTGEIAPVRGTPFDHRAGRAPDPALDHNFCFAPEFGLRARLAAQGGTAVEIWSDAPGLQAYAGGRGVALEPQLWPDAPRHEGFPRILFSPDRPFRQRTRIVLTG